MNVAEYKGSNQALWNESPQRYRYINPLVIIFWNEYVQPVFIE
jgi:hypothetical protein